MKKIILGLLVLLPFLTRAQSPGNDTTKYIYYQFTYGNALDRYYAKKVLLIPNDTTYSKDGLAMKSGTLYIGNGTRWTQVTGGGGSIDTSHLSARIDLKLDSIKRKTGSDSVFFYANGVKTFAFRDSVGSGSPDSAIWKNDAHYTGNHTLTMGSHTQTVVGNVWNFDSLNVLATHRATDTIYWFGDSYFVGYGASDPSVDMATLTSLRLQAIQANHAVFGQLGQTGAGLYIDSITDYNAATSRVLIINWGTNDVYQAAGGTPGIDTTDFKDSVGRWMDSAIIKHHWPASKIVFLSIINFGTAAGPNSVYHANYFSAQKNLCIAKGATFIDMMTPFRQIGGTPFLSGLMFDAIHPNDRGHEVYSTVISAALGYKTIAQGQGVAVNGLIEANNITARALPYANVKSTLIGEDTAGRLVQFNQAAYIPNSLDTIYPGNINIAGDATFGGEIAGTALAISGTDATVPHNCSKCLLMQFNPGTNTGTVDALNFFGAAYNISFNSIFGGGTVMIYSGTPFDATDGFENGGKTYLNGTFRMNSTALATGTTTDSVIVVTTTANVATYKKVAQSSIGGRTSIRFSPRDSAGLTIGFYLDSAGVHVDSVSFDATGGGGGIDSVTLADTAAAIRTVIANANIYTGQGTKLYGADTIAFGGSLSLADTLDTKGFPLLLLNLPSKATTVTGDSVVIKDAVTHQLKVAAIPTGGSGVTSVASGYGTTFSTITGTGTVVVDTSIIMNKANAQTISGNKTFTGTTAIASTSNNQTACPQCVALVTDSITHQVYHETAVPAIGTTFTPTLTNTTNVSSSSLTWAYYFIIGTIVHVSMQIIVVPTASATPCQMAFTFPVAGNSNLHGGGMISGNSAFSYGVVGGGGSTSTTAGGIQFTPTATNSQSYILEFTYGL